MEFGRKPAARNCFDFSRATNARSIPASKPRPWGPLRLLNRTLDTFYVRIGESGGYKGYLGSTGGIAPNSLVYYINGLLAPVLYVRRGKTYTFRIESGNQPHNARFYHPLYISTDPHGGYIKHSDSERKSIHVYAGIDFDKKGRSSPKAAGRLCSWLYAPTSDARKSDNFHSFIQFRSSLQYSCENGNPALLQWTPNASTPDVVWYQSKFSRKLNILFPLLILLKFPLSSPGYTQRNMGWKIFVLDDFTSSAGISGSSSLIVTIFFVIFALILR